MQEKIQKNQMKNKEKFITEYQKLRMKKEEDYYLLMDQLEQKKPSYIIY